MNEWIRGEGESPALLPGSRLLASGVAVYGLVTQVIIILISLIYLRWFQVADSQFNMTI